MNKLSMLCSSMSVEGWSGAELQLAGLTPVLSMRNTLSVDYPALVALAARSPLPPGLLSIDWVRVMAFCYFVNCPKFFSS